MHTIPHVPLNIHAACFNSPLRLPSGNSKEEKLKQNYCFSDKNPIVRVPCGTGTPSGTSFALPKGRHWIIL